MKNGTTRINDESSNDAARSSRITAAIAINRAYYSLLNYESNLAVAGGVCLNLLVDDYIALSQYDKVD